MNWKEELLKAHTRPGLIKFIETEIIEKLIEEIADLKPTILGNGNQLIDQAYLVKQLRDKWLGRKDI